MTGCLTSNTDGVLETGGWGVELTSLVLHRLYVRNYGNMTVNYTDSMKRQDGMNYLLHGDSPSLGRVLHLILIRR